MRQMRDYLEAQVTDWLQAHGGYHFFGFYSLNKAVFLSLPALLRLRVLRHVMARMGPVKFAPPETKPYPCHRADRGARVRRAHAGRVYDPLAGK